MMENDQNKVKSLQNRQVMSMLCNYEKKLLDGDWIYSGFGDNFLDIVVKSFILDGIKVREEGGMMWFEKIEFGTLFIIDAFRTRPESLASHTGPDLTHGVPAG